MPWVTFTVDHVKARMSAREVETYELVSRKEYAEDEGDPPDVPEDSPERLPLIVKQVCDRFRFAILANPAVTDLGPDGTLPEGLVYSAAVIARDALIALPPTEEGMSNPRQKEHDAAEKDLKDARQLPAAVFAVDAPTATASAGYGGKPLLEF